MPQETSSKYSPDTEAENNSKPEINPCRLALITGLREIADKLEAHPEIPEPYIGLALKSFDTAEELTTAVKAYGEKWEKNSDEAYYNLTHTFGTHNLRLQFYIDRTKVCRKIVKGTKVVPEKYVPATECRVIPAHEEEIVEWVCPESLMDEAKSTSESVYDDGHGGRITTDPATWPY